MMEKREENRSMATGAKVSKFLQDGWGDRSPDWRPGDHWDLQRVKDTRSDLGEGRFVEDKEGCYSSYLRNTISEKGKCQAPEDCKK